MVPASSGCLRAKLDCLGRRRSSDRSRVNIERTSRDRRCRHRSWGAVVSLAACAPKALAPGTFTAQIDDDEIIPASLAPDDRLVIQSTMSYEEEVT